MMSCELTYMGPYTSPKKRMIFLLLPDAGRATYVSTPAIVSTLPRVVPTCWTVFLQQSPGGPASVADMVH